MKSIFNSIHRIFLGFTPSYRDVDRNVTSWKLAHNGRLRQLPKESAPEDLLQFLKKFEPDSEPIELRQEYILARNYVKNRFGMNSTQLADFEALLYRYIKYEDTDTDRYRRELFTYVAKAAYKNTPIFSIFSQQENHLRMIVSSIDDVENLAFPFQDAIRDYAHSIKGIEHAFEEVRAAIAKLNELNETYNLPKEITNSLKYVTRLKNLCFLYEFNYQDRQTFYNLYGSLNDQLAQIKHDVLARIEIKATQRAQLKTLAEDAARVVATKQQAQNNAVLD